MGMWRKGEHLEGYYVKKGNLKGIFDNLGKSQLKEVYEREMVLYNEVSKEIERSKSMPTQPSPPKYVPERLVYHEPQPPSQEKMDTDTIKMI